MGSLSSTTLPYTLAMWKEEGKKVLTGNHTPPYPTNPNCSNISSNNIGQCAPMAIQQLLLLQQPKQLQPHQQQQPTQPSQPVSSSISRSSSSSSNTTTTTNC